MAVESFSTTLLRIQYDIALLPEGGSEHCLSAAAPVKHVNKDAAGAVFHEYAMRQAGLFGEHTFLCCCSSPLVMSLDNIFHLTTFFQTKYQICLCKHASLSLTYRAFANAILHLKEGRRLLIL